jgi:2-succinyl-6-hydroxy-2,4-cyclohexadiene-1-carboxylate synthase
MQQMITLLHGFTLAGASWDEVVSKMPGARCVAPDLRGHGRSWRERGIECTMDACTHDLEMLWDRLGVTSSHVVGYSMGGRLALHVATRLPERVRSLLTIGAHAGLEGDAREARRQADEALAARLEVGGIEPFVNYWSAQPMFAGLERRGAGFTARVRALRLANDPAGLAASLRGMGAGAMEPVWGDLPKLQIPCTFVAGEHDAAFVAAARRLGAAVAGSHVELIPRAGHAAQMERPAAFLRVLQAHLARSAVDTDSPTSSLTSA